MKVFGYVRDKNGDFERRKEKVIGFAELMNFSLNKIVCEKSSENYEDMIEIKRLLESIRYKMDVMEEYIERMG